MRHQGVHPWIKEHQKKRGIKMMILQILYKAPALWLCPDPALHSYNPTVPQSNTCHLPFDPSRPATWSLTKPPSLHLRHVPNLPSSLRDRRTLIYWESCMENLNAHSQHTRILFHLPVSLCEIGSTLLYSTLISAIHSPELLRWDIGYAGRCCSSSSTRAFAFV